MLTRAECREALGDMPERTFAQYVARGLPRHGDGEKARYPWPEAFRWVLEQIRRQARDAVKPADLEEAKAREMMARAELAELDLAQKRGELMTVADGERVMVAAFSRISGQIMSWPGKSAPQLAGVKMTAAEVQEKLRLLAQDLLADMRTSVDGLEQELAA